MRRAMAAACAALAACAAAGEAPAWHARAVVYGVTPYVFAEGGLLEAVAEKLPELAELGATVVWLQPLFANHGGGQGYDVVDYFRMRDDVGGEEALRGLVRAAHGLGLKVILDFPANHTSIHHPFAQDAIVRGAESPYWDWYQREPFGARYGRHERRRRVGQMDFVHYFWEDLPNLNLAHPGVRRMLVDAGRHWIERFGVDGYRLDASWGLNHRAPDFLPELARELRALKPDVLLLGEDKAGDPLASAERYDAAYDWTMDEGWVSQWSWQTSYAADHHALRTVFNHVPENRRAAAFRDALAGSRSPSGVRTFRFLENNDTPRFLPTHGIERTRMAALLLFALDGIPLVFNGQEIGEGRHPYETDRLFERGRSIRELDRHGLFDHYRELARLRASHPALHGGDVAEAAAEPAGRVYAFRRRAGGESIWVAANLGGGPCTARLALEADGLAEDGPARLVDLMTGEVFAVAEGRPRRAEIPLAGTSARMLRLCAP